MNLLRRFKVSEFLFIYYDVGGYQFEMMVDGYCVYLVYMDLGKQMLDIYWIFVLDLLWGCGIVVVLIEYVLQYVDCMGYSVILFCFYVECYIECCQCQVDLVV